MLAKSSHRNLGSEAPENEETEEITGILEVTRQRHGFLSVEGSDDDVYVSASQVRRCEMKEGDEVTGPVRAPRRGERHRALVRVEPRERRAARRCACAQEAGRGRRQFRQGRPLRLAHPCPTFSPHRAARRCGRPRSRRRPPGAARLRPARPGEGRAASRAHHASPRPRAGSLAVVEGVELTVLLDRRAAGGGARLERGGSVGRSGACPGRPLARRAGQGRPHGASSAPASRPRRAPTPCSSATRCRGSPLPARASTT